MGLFKKKKDKPKKPKDRYGCLSKALFFLLIIFILVAGIIGGINMAGQALGDTLTKIAEFIEDFNNVPTLATLHERFGTESLSTYLEFQNQADACGFNGYTNLEGVLSLDNSLRMRDNVFGNALSRYLSNQTELLNLAAFTITSDNTITIIYRYDLRQVQSLLGTSSGSIPGLMFITNTYTFEIKPNEFNVNQITATKTSTILNNMTTERSEELFSYLKDIDSAQIKTSLFNTYDTLLFRILNDIAIKTETQLSLTYEEGLGYVNLVK